MKSILTSDSVVALALGALLLSQGCRASTPSAAQARVAVNEQNAMAATPRDKSNQEIQPSIKLFPVDEGTRDASFEDFRNQFLAAVRKRDRAFLMKVVDPAIDNGYDIERGVNEFQERWKPTDPDSSLWEVLSGILTGGGSFSERNGHTDFCGPYVISQWSSVVKKLPKGSDSLDYVAITNKDVSVHLEPNLASPVVVMLSYDVVKAVPNSQVLKRSIKESSSWIKIETSTGQAGFVPDNYIQSPMDFGACFRKTNGSWVLRELAARE